MATAAETEQALYTVFDPIHGQMDFPSYVEQLTSICEFQRLRHLKQLGASARFFGSANITRFEHCLGVCWLAIKLMNTLETNSGVSIGSVHRKCVTIAALFHDIGHGPFSHLWETFVRLQNPECEWHHETMSSKLVAHIFKKYDLKFDEGVEETRGAVELTQALIVGNLDVALKHLGAENMFLTEIVNNRFAQIDVDKCDYLLRDAYFLKGNVELRQFADLLDNVRVLRDNEGRSHVSYHFKDFPKIENLFHNRANLHIYCYQEATVRGIELMICDILKAADDAGFLLKGKRLSEIHEDIRCFNFLDDSVLNLIRCSEDPRLGAAQNLISRLWSSDFYALVWMTPHHYNMTTLVEKFGDHFIQIQKRIPLTSVFIHRNILLHDDEGTRVPVPEESIVKRNGYFEEYLIFSRDTNPELIQNVLDFFTDVKDGP